MIIHRVRPGHRKQRESVQLTAVSIFALARYVVDADRASVSVPGQIVGVTGYLTDAMEIWAEPGEKVAAFGAFNCLGKSLPDWQIDMAAVAMTAPRSKDPLEHFVFSWRDETPTAAQVEEAAGIILKTLGFAECPAMWAWHTNTKRQHGHLAVVRVNRETGKVAGSRWDLDVGQQAMAIVAEAQGWALEKGAHYYAKDGAVFRVKTHEMVRDAEGNELKRQRRKRAGLPDAFRSVSEKLREAGREAHSWEDFHARFRALGACYDAKGSGAVISINDIVVKASQVDPNLSLKTLEKALSKSFSPDSTRIDREFEGYQAACRAENVRLRAERKLALRELDDSAEAALDAAGKSVEANALFRQQAIRSEHEVAIKAFNEACDAAMHKFASRRLSASDWRAADKPAPPSVAAPTLIYPGQQIWGGYSDADSVLDNANIRSSLVHPGKFGLADLPRRLRSSQFKRSDEQQAQGIASNSEWQADDYERRVDGLRTTYVDTHGRPAFVDCGNVVIVLNPAHDRTVEAALQLAAARWTVIEVQGSPEFIALSVKIAERRGIVLTDRAGTVLTSVPQPTNVHEMSAEQAPDQSANTAQDGKSEKAEGSPRSGGPSPAKLFKLELKSHADRVRDDPTYVKTLAAVARYEAKLQAEENAWSIGPPRKFEDLLRIPKMKTLDSLSEDQLKKFGIRLHMPERDSSANNPPGRQEDLVRADSKSVSPSPIVVNQVQRVDPRPARVSTVPEPSMPPVRPDAVGPPAKSDGRGLPARLLHSADEAVARAPPDFAKFRLNGRDRYGERLHTIAKEFFALPTLQPFAADMEAVVRGIGRIEPHIQFTKGPTAIALVHPPLKASLERVLATPELAAFIDALFTLGTDPSRFPISQDVDFVILRGQNAVDSARGLPTAQPDTLSPRSIRSLKLVTEHLRPDRSRGR